MQKSLLFKISLYSFLLLSSSFLTAQTCEISNVFAEAYECDDDGNFLIDITFDVDNPGDLGFSIKENGMAYIDTLAYGQTAYTIGPFLGDCSTYYTFAIVDNTNNNCKGFYTFDEPICCSTTDCDISVSNITLSDCDSSGYRTLIFDVENTGNSALGFNLLYRNAPVAIFNYGNNPYSISIPGVTYVHDLVIQDKSDPICRAFLSVENDDCSGFENCDYLNITKSHEFICTSDTTYLAYTYFDYNGSSDSIYLVFNNSKAELFSINENPILLGEFLVSNELFEYSIHDQNDVFCFTGSEWNDAPDCSNFENCDISRVFAEAQECNDNGLFYVDIEFVYAGIGNQGFKIRGNGVSYGDTFQYGQTFYTVGPLEGDCSTLFEFVVIDNVNPDCNAFYEFEEPVCCDDVIECEIRDIEVDSFICNEDGTYGLILNFIYEGNTNDFFDVWAGNEFIGFYRYDDMPIYIDTFYSRDVEFDLIRICDNDNADCCVEHEFVGPNCEEEGNCGIYDVFAEAHDCINDSLFYVDIEFQSENVGINGFEIRGNGVSYGDTFQYGQTLYTVGPLEGDCETIYEFVVIDNEDPDCRSDYNFEEPICCGEEIVCDIRDIEIDSFFCNDDGTYWLVLDFVYEGNTNEFFDVWAGNEFVGFYRYEDLPVFIDTFYPRDVEFDLIRICDNDNDACCAIHEFIGPDCDEEENCGIYDVFAEAHECTSDSLFYVDIEFQSENVGINGFEIRGNGVSYGDTFQYGQTFYTVGPLEGDCETIYEFVVIDNDDPNCRNDYNFDAPICCGEEIICDIRDIVVDSFFCNEDGTYGLILNFIYEGNTNDFFDVWAGNEFVGFYRYDELPIFIDTFYSREVEYDLIRICDNDNDACCAVHEFIGPDCEGEENCGIFDVFAEAHECTNDSLFFVDIEFQSENVGINGFEIRGNGVSYGDSFQYGETFYTVGPLEGDCETIYEFLVIDNDNPDCQNEFNFEEPICCGEELICDIRDIEVDSFFCNENGTYWLILDFIYEGNTNDFFDVWAGNEFVGFYRYEDLPVFIDTFYSQDIEYDLIRICDNDNPECCAELEFLGPNCDEIIDSVTERPIDRLDIYSNDKRLLIKTETDINYYVSIYNLNGQLISKSTAQGDLIKSIDVPDGVYLVKVFDLKNGGFVSKLLYF